MNLAVGLGIIWKWYYNDLSNNYGRILNFKYYGGLLSRLRVIG